MPSAFRPGDAVQARYGLGGLFFATVPAGTVGVLTRVDGNRLTVRFDVDRVPVTMDVQPHQVS